MKKTLITLSILAAALTGFAQQTIEPTEKELKSRKEDDVLVLSFFRNDGELGTYLAWSEDGIHFKPLNHDQPVFKPANWLGQNLTRDPSIVFHDGLFRAVWTSSWEGSCFGYSESTDLLNWTNPVRVEPFPKTINKKDQPLLIWAPEICWDPVQKNYAIIWTTVTERDRDGKDRGQTGKEGNWGSCQYITRTKDGKSFTPAEPFFRQNFTSIDGFLVFDTQGKTRVSKGRWIMVLKDEREVALGGKNIRMAFAPFDFSQPWTPVSSPVAGSNSPIRPLEMAEGPSLIKWQGKWFLYWDAFADGHYGVAVSDNLKVWTDSTQELVMPVNPRHGTVFRAPRSIVKKLE